MHLDAKGESAETGTCCQCVPAMNRVFASWRTPASPRRKGGRKNRTASDSSGRLPLPQHQSGDTDTGEFVNHGLARWNALREAWTAESISPEKKKAPLSDSQEDDIYDELFRPEYRKFPKNTKLSDVIRIIPEVWEKVG